MTKKQLCHILEIARWTCIAVGFNLTYFSGQTPAGQLHIFMPWVVVSIAGLTGFESLFLGEAAAELSGYGANPAYQRQSGLNNIALAITALIVSLAGWGTHAEAAVMLVLLIFLTLSASNHAWTAWKENNRTLKNILRPVMTVLLLIFMVPFLIKALNG